MPFEENVYGWIFMLLLLVVVSYWRSRNNDRKRQGGPKSWPLIGSALELMANANRRCEWSTEYARRFPTFGAKFFSKRIFFTVDPAVVEHILKTNSPNYVKGPGAYEINYDLLGDGIFNADGEMWRVQRKAASLEFSSRILRDYSTNAFRKWGLRLANILQHKAENMEVVNMQDMFMRMTFDSICEVGFGVEICSLSPSLPDVPFASAFDRCNSVIARRYGDPLWKLKRYFNVGREAKLKEDLKVIDDFTYGLIQRRRESMDPRTEAKQDLLSRILTFQAGQEQTPNMCSDKYMRDFILSFVIAGRDTTAVTLSWFLYLLCNNPKPRKIIHEELVQMEQQLSGGRNDCPGDRFSGFADLLTYDTVSRLQYLHAAITEALRLYPAVPMDPKEAVGEDTLPDGTKISKGNVVTYIPYAMGRMERLWGVDALEFKPERWLKDGVFRPESPFKFTTFQAGPRICIGKDSAYLQMKIAAAILLRFFGFEMLDTHQVQYLFAITLQMSSEGLPMKVKLITEDRVSLHSCNCHASDRGLYVRGIVE